MAIRRGHNESRSIKERCLVPAVMDSIGVDSGSHVLAPCPIGLAFDFVAGVVGLQLHCRRFPVDAIHGPLGFPERAAADVLGKLLGVLFEVAVRDECLAVVPVAVALGLFLEPLDGVPFFIVRL